MLIKEPGQYMPIRETVIFTLKIMATFSSHRDGAN
jgi:hypothetical protein